MSTSVRDRIVLTDREIQILGMAAEGLSNSEIGDRIHITEDTVKTHVGRVFRKLGARNRAHAVHLAHTLGVPMPAHDDLLLPVLAPEPPRELPSAPTHLLSVFDPASPDVRQVTSIAAANTEEAHRHMRLFAGQLRPSQRVFLYRANDTSRPLARMQGFRA